MRIMFDVSNGVFTDVEEIATATISPSGMARNNVAANLYIDLYRSGDTEDTCIGGQYNLDGTMATYEKAIANWQKVSTQLLEKGFVRESDFENVTWF